MDNMKNMENTRAKNSVSYTEEQLEAIKYKSSNVLVSASAGSGKTAVLIERILKLLADEDISLCSLAVMTFTKAAAAQMKDKLRAGIQAKISEGEGADRWQRLLYELPNAYITTIDSFCSSVVRDNFYRLGIETDFRIMEPIDESLLENEVWQSVLESALEGEINTDMELARLNDYFELGISGEGLKEAVLMLSHFCDSEPWQDEFLDRILTDYEDINENSPLSLYYARLHQIQPLEAAAYISQNSDMDIAAPVIRALVAVTRKFRSEMLKKKRAVGSFSFSDIEHFALNTLVDRVDGVSHKSSVGQSYADSLSYILVDEYQDSNYLQEELINAISNGRNVFMVGDFKQSIYGFRQAKPEIFSDKLAAYEAAKSGRAIYLSKNFRSDKKILDFVNRVCSYAMDGIKYGYKYEGEQLLAPGRADEGRTAGEIELMLVAKGYSYDADEMEAHYAAALAIGQKILALVGDSGENIAYKDIAVLMRAKSGRASYYIKAFESLGIPYELDSANGFLEGIEVKSLIDYLRALDNGLQDVALASAMLSHLGGFAESELAALRLMSGQDSFCRAIYDCAEAYDRLNEPEYLRGLLRYGELTEDDIALLEKAKRFFAELKRYRSYSYIYSIAELIKLIIKEKGFRLYASVLKNADKRLEELRQLENLARSFDGRAYNNSLSDFIHYLDRIYENGLSIDRKGVGTADMNAVRLMTVHGSKGLEMPVVFYADIGSRFNIRSESISVSSLGLGIPVLDLERRIRRRSLIKELIDDCSKRMQVEEELRLMYVAMTRAMKKLYMVVQGDLFSKLRSAVAAKHAELIKAAKEQSLSSIADYVLPIFTENVEFFLKSMYLTDREKTEKELSGIGAELLKAAMAADEEGLWHRSGEYEALTELSDTGLKLTLCGRMDADQIKAASFVSSDNTEGEDLHIDSCLMSEAEADELAKDIRRSLSFRYPGADKDKPGKLSVTGYSRIIKQREDDGGETSVEIMDSELVPKLNMNIKSKKDITQGLSLNPKSAAGSAADIGTAYHKIMEMWDFRMDYTTAADVKGMLERLTDEKRIRAELTGGISTSELLAFTRSDIYRRMKAAELDNRLFRERGFVYRTNVSEVYEGAGTQEIMIEGIVDAYFIEADRLVLVDYKSDRSKNPDYYIKNYRASMELYAGALRQAYKIERTELIIYSMKIGEIRLDKMQKLC